MRQFDINHAVANTGVPSTPIKPENIRVGVTFTINGGEKQTREVWTRVFPHNDMVDYAHLLDLIALPNIKSDIRVIPSTINGICGGYKYSIDTISINLLGVVRL